MQSITERIEKEYWQEPEHEPLQTQKKSGTYSKSTGHCTGKIYVKGKKNLGN